MSNETKRLLERNFHVDGAGRRGMLWLMTCVVVAYFPQVAHAISHAGTAAMAFLS